MPPQPCKPAPLPQMSLSFRSSQAHHQVLLIPALPSSHRYHLPFPPSPEPRTRLSRAAPQRSAPLARSLRSAEPLGVEIARAAPRVPAPFCQASDSASTHCKLSFRRHAQRRDATRRSSCSAPFGIDACRSADAHCSLRAGRSECPAPPAPSSRPPAEYNLVTEFAESDHIPPPPAQ